jgi:hypothetical protein
MSVAIGTGILADYALRMANDGCTAEYIAECLEEAKHSVKLIAMFDTLEFLKRGGRISKTAAIAGGLLSIKPVLTIKDGEIAILGKARGSKQANNYLVNEIEASGGIDFSMPLLLGYTGLSDVTLQKYIEDSAFLWEAHTDELESAIIGSVVGTHAGPGAIAVAFFKKYMPDKNLPLIWSSSWIFNPAWRDYLPTDTNMVKLMNSGNIFPACTKEKHPGLYFVFGTHEGSPDDFTAGNSMQKAFLQCFRDNNLRSAGFFIPADML